MGGGEAGEARVGEAGEVFEAEGEEGGEMGEGGVVEVVGVEGGEGEVLEGGEMAEGCGDDVVFEDGAWLGVEEKGCEVSPAFVVFEEGFRLLAVHEAWRELDLGAGCHGVVFADEPDVRFEIFACREGVGEAVEGVVVGVVEPDQSFQVGACHHDRGDEIDGLSGESSALWDEVGDFELPDEVCQ